MTGPSPGPSGAAGDPSPPRRRHSSQTAEIFGYKPPDPNSAERRSKTSKTYGGKPRLSGSDTVPTNTPVAGGVGVTLTHGGGTGAGAPNGLHPRASGASQNSQVLNQAQQLSSYKAMQRHLLEEPDCRNIAYTLMRFFDDFEKNHPYLDTATRRAKPDKCCSAQQMASEIHEAVQTAYEQLLAAKSMRRKDLSEAAETQLFDDLEKFVIKQRKVYDRIYGPLKEVKDYDQAPATPVPPTTPGDRAEKKTSNSQGPGGSQDEAKMYERKYLAAGNVHLREGKELRKKDRKADALIRVLAPWLDLRYLDLPPGGATEDGRKKAAFLMEQIDGDGASSKRPGGGVMAEVFSMFTRVDAVPAPSDKLLLLTQGCKSIMKVLGDCGKAYAEQEKGASGKSGTMIVGADDFMPMLIFCLLRVNPARAWSNVDFVEKFRAPSRMTGERMYYFMQYQAALTYITGRLGGSNAQAASELKMERAEFERLCQKALKGEPIGIDEEKAEPAASAANGAVAPDPDATAAGGAGHAARAVAKTSEVASQLPSDAAAANPSIATPGATETRQSAASAARPDSDQLRATAQDQEQAARQTEAPPPEQQPPDTHQRLQQSQATNDQPHVGPTDQQAPAENSQSLPLPPSRKQSTQGQLKNYRIFLDADMQTTLRDRLSLRFAKTSDYPKASSLKLNEISELLQEYQQMAKVIQMLKECKDSGDDET